MRGEITSNEIGAEKRKRPFDLENYFKMIFKESVYKKRNK